MDKILVLDFGGQYNQLVARRVRECNVYCEIASYRTDLEIIKGMDLKGIILTGGPNSCYEPGAPTYRSAADAAGARRQGGARIGSGVRPHGDLRVDDITAFYRRSRSDFVLDEPLRLHQ